MTGVGHAWKFARDDGYGNNWSATTSCMISRARKRDLRCLASGRLYILRDADGPEGFVGLLVIAGLIRTG